jgi:ribosomal protein S6--L-glutamate ligase
MRIAILSRSAQLYSTRSLLEAGIKRGHEMEVIDHARCSVWIERGDPDVFFEDYSIYDLDAVIPRIGASITLHGAAVIRQFEAMNVYTPTRADGLVRARDKLQCLQALSLAGVEVPRTFFVNQTSDVPFLLEELGGAPVVIKLLESTHGMGVILAETNKTAISIIEAFSKSKEKILVQEFISEAHGADIRAFVVGDEIVATMERQAPEGDFRSNLHRGATARKVDLTRYEQQVVIQSARAMRLEVAGVDFLRGRRGPLVMEVNASPGLEGIETTTGVDIAGKIITYVEQNVKASKK